jgi:hypothetical protein
MLYEKRKRNLNLHTLAHFLIMQHPQTCYEAARRLSPDTSPMLLDISASRTIRNKLYYINYPLSGILLQEQKID